MRSVARAMRERWPTRGDMLRCNRILLSRVAWRDAHRLLQASFVVTKKYLRRDGKQRRFGASNRERAQMCEVRRCQQRVDHDVDVVVRNPLLRCARR